MVTFAIHAIIILWNIIVDLLFILCVVLTFNFNVDIWNLKLIHNISNLINNIMISNFGGFMIHNLQ